MIIKEVHIKNFGKIQNQTYTFSKGMNLIYGENEAGKSTLQQFIKAMLFGLEKKRGRASAEDGYSRYEPWDAPSYFSGSLIFETGGQSFLLERNFYHKEAAVRLINMGDLEELSVERGDLTMLLGGITRTAYENTYCILQGMSVPGKELGTLLADEKANLVQTGDSGFQLSEALEKLSQKKKQLEKQRKEAESKRMAQAGQLQSKQQLLEDHIGQLRDKICAQAMAEAELEMKLRQYKNQENILMAQSKQRSPEVIERGHDMKKQWNPLVIIGVAGALLMQLLLTWMSWPTAPCRIVQVVFAVLVVVGIVRTMRSNEAEDRAREQAAEDHRIEQGLKQRQIQEQQQACYTEFRAVQATRETYEQEMQEMEVQLENLRCQQEELQAAGPEERNLVQEMESIVLAAETMERLAAVMTEETDDFINGRMSQILSAVTGGKYDDLQMDANQQLSVAENYHMRMPEAYSQATKQQMYFSYRMAAGELLGKEEALPFLFDEAFASYDEGRLKEVLRWLAAQKNQSFVFTCRRLEGELLRSMGIAFAEIEL